jgi:phage-related protein
MQSIKDNFGDIVKWGRRIGSIIAVITAAALAMKVLTGAVWLLTFAVTANPITLFAIAAVAALALIVAFWPEISGFFTNLWQGIVEISSAIAEKVGAVISTVWNVYKTAWKAIFEFFVGLVMVLVGPIIDALRPLFAYVEQAAAFIVEVWRPILSFFFDVFATIGSYAMIGFGKLVEGATWSKDLLIGIATSIRDFYVGIWTYIFDQFMAIVGPAIDKIGWAIEKLRSLGRATLGSDESEDGSGATAPAAQVVSPAGRVASSISETTSTNQSELLIRDQTGAHRSQRMSRGRACL